MKRELTIKKLEDGKYALISGTEEIERTEVVNEDYLRNQYKELIEQKNKILFDLQGINKKLKDSPVVFDEELEKFIALADKAAEYKKFMQLKDIQKGTTDMLEMINDSMKPIEAILPITKRLKK